MSNQDLKAENTRDETSSLVADNATNSRALLDRSTPRPWEIVAGDNCGHYGSGPDTHEGFTSYALVDSKGRTIVDTYNSGVAVVYEEIDEDGKSGWDEQGRINIGLIHNAVNNHDTLTARVAELEAENTWLCKQTENLQESVREEANAVIAANDKITALKKALEAMICFRCENRIGYVGPTTEYGDWRSCSSCAGARAALKGTP